MIYSIQRKRMSPVLCNEYKVGFKPPKGIKFRVALDGSNGAVFQFFAKDEAVSPVLANIDVTDDMIIGRLKDGSRVTLDLENRSYSEPFAEVRNGVALGLENELYYLEKGGVLVRTRYDVEKPILAAEVEKAYKINHLISVKDASDKCAIFDTVLKRPITDFVFEKGKFDVSAIINAEYNSDGEPILIVESELKKGEQASPIDTDKWLSLISTTGENVARLKSSGFLWKKPAVEPTENGEEKSYLYVAFRTGVGRDNIKTQILKIDAEQAKVVKTIEVPFEADISLQPYKRIATTQDGSMILITKRQFKQFAGLGAVKVSKEGEVSQLLDNNCAEINIHYETGRKPYIDYKKGKEFGRVALDSSKHTFETSRASFVKMYNRCVPRKPKTAEGLAPASAQQISAEPASNAKSEDGLIEEESSKPKQKS